MLRLDLMRLDTPERFENLCFRLAQAEYPSAIAVAMGSWDRGRDIHELAGSNGKEEVVWQCKFTTDLGDNTRRAIIGSLETLAGRFSPDPRVERANMKQLPTRNRLRMARSMKRRRHIDDWILCLPVDPTGVFVDWVRTIVAKYPFIKHMSIWGKRELLRRLERRPDIVHLFFYSQYVELREHFETEELELIRFKLAAGCEWIQPDPKVLIYQPSKNVASPDFVLDVVVRNRGALETMLAELIVQLRGVRRTLHGVPDDGLLFPKIEYRISIDHGKPGDYKIECEPPLRIPPHRMERFKVAIFDTGYAWNGTFRVVLGYAPRKCLCLPWMRLST